MPRPGPRPYECVRRAWHSDRHQPIRGSIIQQLFRLVNETHSSLTKKNREWQEKLPIVVLKVEEIIYSKANSEAEYMDLQTLWERMNDAINVIIRKDDTIESGDLLHPCIEAALNLGCVPVRASRSQRHTNPRTYLTPTAEEPTSIPLPGFDNTATTERCAQLPLCPSGNVFGRSTPTNCHLSNPVTDRHVTQNGVPNGSRGFPFLYENLPPRTTNQSMAMETNTPLKLGSVYPLYYGTHYQSEESLSGFCTSQHENDNNKIFVGTPVGTSVVEPSNKIALQLQNLFTSDNRMERTLNTYDRAPEITCDLSLQLGFSSNMLVKNPGLETIDSGGKFKNKEICLFPSKTGFDAFGSCSSKWNSDDVIGPNMDTTPPRKRKILISENMDQFTKWPGL